MKLLNSGQDTEPSTLAAFTTAGETPAPPKTNTRKYFGNAFTLVEILIVVVILGILAAIVTALFNTTVDDAAQQATYSELEKLRRHVGVYKVRNMQELPAVEEGDGTWGPLVGEDHFLSPPVNAWVGGANARVIIFGEGPDLGYQRDYGWIYDPISGDVWAGGFDAEDNPYARNEVAEAEEED